MRFDYDAHTKHMTIPSSVKRMHRDSTTMEICSVCKTAIGEVALEIDCFTDLNPGKYVTDILVNDAIYSVHTKCVSLFHLTPNLYLEKEDAQ
jgi:hypothetical protein